MLPSNSSKSISPLAEGGRAFNDMVWCESDYTRNYCSVYAAPSWGCCTACSVGMVHSFEERYKYVE